MARKTVPVITEWCSHCNSEVEIKGTMRWHKCPKCGNYIAPCSLCDSDKVNCNENCPLIGKKKPVEKIGSHIIDEIFVGADSISLIFDYEDCSCKTFNESFKIVVTYFWENDEFRFHEKIFDMYLNTVGTNETRQHLTDHEARLAKRRLLRIARNLDV